MKPGLILGLYGGMDILLAGMGMGVPFFCILLGFPVGWYLAARQEEAPTEAPPGLRWILQWAALTSGLTFLLMAVLWGRTIPMLFDPASDFANFGHPFILYDPKPSFIGWLVLMILVSPFLQFLLTVFGANLRIVTRRA